MFGAIAVSLVLAFSPLLVTAPVSDGLKVEVYTYNPSATPDRKPYELCATETAATTAPDINFDVGGDIVAGCAGDFVLIHYSGWITSPVDRLMKFSSRADDGFYLSIADQTVIDDWTLKGCWGSWGIFPMNAGLSYKLDAWYYEYGGGACNQLSWDANGYDEIVPASAFTQTPTEPVLQQPTLNAPWLGDWQVDGNTLDVNWTDLPTKTPIERWAVSYSYGDQSYAIASTEEKATLNDLPWDTDVTVKIRADNDSLGVYSDWSDSFTFHTGTQPQPQPTPQPTIPIVVPPIVEPPVDPQPPVIPPVVVPPVVDPQPQPPVVEPSPEPTTTPDEPVSVGVSATEEHQMIMDQLWQEATKDDIQVDAAIANIPVFGAAAVAVVDAINYIGNIGSDMTPTVRKKAKQTLVSAVIATQIAQFSTQSALTSAASNGPTSSTRRRVKE
jgi:hypothetical protein